jgi:hypothetical protein
MRPQQLDHKDARIHYATLNQHTPTPTPASDPPKPVSVLNPGCECRPSKPAHHGLVPSGPNRMPRRHHPTPTAGCAHTPHQEGPYEHHNDQTRAGDFCQCLRHRAPHDHPRAVTAAGTTPRRGGAGMLLRKEVIQPHLPVRLPCYDFVPIASPTFDRSPPHGLGHGLRVLPTFVT